MEGGNRQKTTSNHKSDLTFLTHTILYPKEGEKKNGGRGGGGGSLSRKFNLKDRTECRRVKHENLYSDLLK